MNLFYQVSFYLFLIAGISFAGLKPEYNWDMICYMGKTLELDKQNEGNTHHETYNILNTEIDKDNYSRLTSGKYRNEILNNEEAFNETLPFYSIKILYIWLILLLYDIGVPLTFATVIPSLISVFLLIIFIHRILIKELKNYLLGSLIPLIILFLPQILFLAKISTPDALSTLLIFSLSLLYIYKRNSNFIFFIMILAILTRTDNIIWCTLLLSIDMILNKNKTQLLFQSLKLIGLIALFLFISNVFDNGGWEILFYSTFVERQIFPLSSSVELTPQIYIIAIIKRIPYFLPYFFSIIVIMLPIKKINVLLSFQGGKILIICVLSFIIKFFLFPSYDSRFYITPLLILFITLIIGRNHFKKIYLKS